ncbi:MAG TPA: YciI family protein [Acidimicrobiales bacterium]|nr:YciI family protein [Acidimicrobiales bacterium]
MTIFALTMVHGPSWDAALQIREQRAWNEHAAFMDRLVDEGFVVLGGPVGDGEQTLLVVEAADEHEVEARLDGDPWATPGLLRIGEVRPWTVWLDGTRRARSA